MSWLRLVKTITQFSASVTDNMISKWLHISGQPPGGRLMNASSFLLYWKKKKSTPACFYCVFVCACVRESMLRNIHWPLVPLLLLGGIFSQPNPLLNACLLLNQLKGTSHRGERSAMWSIIIIPQLLQSIKSKNCSISLPLLHLKDYKWHCAKPRTNVIFLQLSQLW